MNYFLGEIRSGEQFKTDTTPVALKPVFFSITLTPNPVVKSGSIFVQVVVRDIPVSTQ